MLERTNIGELSERNIEYHVLVNTSIEIAIDAASFRAG